MIRLAHGDFREVSYFSAAYAMVLAAQGLFLQIFLAFSSFLSKRLVEAGPGEVARWTRRLVRGLSLVLAPAVGGLVWFGPPLIPIILGEAYQPAGRNLSFLAWNLLLLVPAGLANLLAVVFEKPRATALAGALRIVLFWGLGAWWTPRGLSLGTALAVLCANFGYAVFFAARARRWSDFSLRPWLAAVGWTLLVPVLRGFWPTGWSAAAGYGGWLLAGLLLVWTTHAAAREDLSLLWQRLRRLP